MSGRHVLAVCALILAGYGLTLLVFYPGVMTYDAKYVFEDITKSVLGDWQSPAMTVLWRLINPIAPGSGSMFLLIITAYWLAFGTLAFALARRTVVLAVLLPLLALTPPAFVFAGIIWRDVLFSVTWLLAGSIAFIAVERGAVARISLQALALALCGFGVLLRPNALIAAPMLAAYTIWPNQFSWKRTAIVFRAGHGGVFWPGAGCLLRRARSHPATSAAIDHGLRSRRHQPFLPGRTSFPSAGMRPRPRCS